MRRVVAAVLVLTLPACTFGIRRNERPARPAGTYAAVTPPPCRASYAAPDPARPRVSVTFEVDESHAVVTGTETVAFTPDRPVRDVVFRLWANAPSPVSYGGRVEVTRASHPMTFEGLGAGAGTQGTLVRLALPAEVPAGERVRVSLDFRLRLPRASVDRLGHTPRTAWWASAHPMLAWVRGSGWDTTPAVGILGETAVNETAVYDVTVVAPFADTVLSIGAPGEPEATASGKRRWRFRNATARDVAVSVGPFTTRTAEVSGVPVTYAVSDELATGPDAERFFGPMVALTEASMRRLVPVFGPFPYPSLTVVALEPIRGSGVEYPGKFWVGTRRYDVVVPHELAHEWFYGLVGNDQGDHPWLDESLASYAEALVNEGSAEEFERAADDSGDVGEPMAYWDEHREDYGPVVYHKGAGVLLLARQTVGAKAFDALMRCFVRTYAHRVASPDDFARAFAPAPAVLDLLREAGALP